MRKCIFALSLALLLGVMASADIVVSDSLFFGATNEWRTWDMGGGNNPTSPGPNNPYWDRASDDGTNCNIGFILAGTASGCLNQVPVSLPLAGAPGMIPYLSAQGDILTVGIPGDGGAPRGFTFNNTTPSNNISLVIEVAGNAAGNAFGIYTGSYANKTELFSGPTSGPITVSLTAANFGFYVTNSTGTYYTDPNSADGGNQHFALFTQEPTYPDHTVASGTDRTTNTYWIGVEDKMFTATGQAKADGDYNDMILRVTQVPEPTSVLLFGTLLAGAGILTRRLRRS